MVGRHEWNSLEDYCRITESVLEHHPFISRHSVSIDGPYEYADSELYYLVDGTVECVNGARVILRKYLDVRDGRKDIEVRARTFRYQAMQGDRELLRYDNSSGIHSYHVHRWGLDGQVINDHLAITREQMPHLSDVLTELQAIFKD